MTVKEEVAKNLMYYRKKSGLTQKDLAGRLGVTNASISNWEHGVNSIDIDTLHDACKILDVPMNSMFGIYSNAQYGDTATTPIGIYGSVAAGLGSYASGDNNFDESIDIPNSWMNKSENYFCLRVVGDSMYPIFIEDDIVLLKHQSSVDSGSFAVMLIDGDEGVIKKVTYDKNSTTLHSINPMFQDRVFRDSELGRLRVIGLVKKVIRDYE